MTYDLPEVMPGQAEYLALVVECVNRSATVPTAVAHPEGLVELWVNDRCVGGWITVEVNTQAGRLDDQTGWFFAGRHCASTTEAFNALQTAVRR